MANGRPKTPARSARASSVEGVANGWRATTQADHAAYEKAEVHGSEYDGINQLRRRRESRLRRIAANSDVR